MARFTLQGCQELPPPQASLTSVQLLDAADRLLRVLFLDREGHISAEPPYVPREEASIFASNQQQVLGPQARVQVL